MKQSMPHMPLDLAGVCFSAEGRDILVDISLSSTHRRIGVVGRNGSGKSTLARLIAGLFEPTSGQVRLGEIEPASDRQGALAAVGILFQNPDHQIIFPTVIEELTFGLRQQGKSKDVAADDARLILESFGKSHWEHAAIHLLSQGQKHLVCLMAIMAMQPRLIVLDEPFAGLDAPTKMQLTRYLDRYDGQVIHITHDPADIANYDEVIWLEAGRLEAQGTAETVLAAYHKAMLEAGATDDIADLAG